MKQRQTELAEADRLLHGKNTELAIAEDKLKHTQFRAGLAESRQAHAEREAQRLEQRQTQLQREVEPLQSAAEILQEYSGGRRKPSKKDVPALAAELAKTKSELEYSIKDRQGLFEELRQTEKENSELQKSADTLHTLRRLAPDKLNDAIKTAEQRKAAKRSTPFKGSGNGRSK